MIRRPRPTADGTPPRQASHRRRRQRLWASASGTRVSRPPPPAVEVPFCAHEEYDSLPLPPRAVLPAKQHKAGYGVSHGGSYDVPRISGTTFSMTTGMTFGVAFRVTGSGASYTDRVHDPSARGTVPRADGTLTRVPEAGGRRAGRRASRALRSRRPRS